MAQLKVVQPAKRVYYGEKTQDSADEKTTTPTRLPKSSQGMPKLVRNKA